MSVKVQSHRHGIKENVKFSHIGMESRKMLLYSLHFVLITHVLIVCSVPLYMCPLYGPLCMALGPLCMVILVLFLMVQMILGFSIEFQAPPLPESLLHLSEGMPLLVQLVKLFEDPKFLWIRNFHMCPYSTIKLVFIVKTYF